MSYIEYHELKQLDEKQAQANPPKEQMISADALKKQIAKVKKCFASENSDYMTGYISAMSVVEGMIAYLEAPEETNTRGGNIFEDKTESGLLEE